MNYYMYFYLHFLGGMLAVTGFLVTSKAKEDEIIRGTISLLICAFGLALLFF